MSPGVPGGGDGAVAVVEQPAELLANLSTTVYGRLRAEPVGDLPDGPDHGWVSAADLLVDPQLLDPLIDRGATRFRSDDRALVVAQVARETVSALTTMAVDLWVRQRRLLDLSAANVVLEAGDGAFVVGVRRVALAVLAGDSLAGHPGVEVVDEARMFEGLVNRSIGEPVPEGTLPPGRPGSVAAVAAIIAAVRCVVRCGDRHLWGTAALAASNAASLLNHTHGRQADDDRAALLSARPDLARTIELVAVPEHGACDDADDVRRATNGDEVPEGEITFALRRTCCLLLKLPDGLQCGTCSLRDRDVQVDRMTDWHRQQRRVLRRPHDDALDPRQ